MKNILIWILIVAIIVNMGLVTALDECQEIVTASTNCEVVTPVISCATYDLYNPSHVLDTDDGSMTQIGTTGVYYFTFNKATAGDWTILLCSNHSSIITIGTTDQVNMNSINTTLYNKIDSTNSSLYAHLTNVNSSVISSIGLLSANLTSINSTLYNQINAINVSISTDVSNLNTNLLSINNTLYAEVDTLEENLTRFGSNSTWIGNSVWTYDTRTIDFSNSTGSINATVTVNNTAIAGAVWDYNLTKAGYSTNNTGVAGSIQRYIALTIYWVERLLP